MYRLALIVSLALLLAPLSLQAAPPLEFEPPSISGGAAAADQAARFSQDWLLEGSQTGGVMGAAAYTPGVGFDAYNFDDNATETGSVFIPPDPIGAAGPDRLLAVVNVGIECRSKTGTLLFRDSLKDFFSALGSPATLGTFTFDPKVVYDQYEGRFVVITLERTDVTTGGASDASRILVAVSKTSSPATATSADWWYHSIDSKITVGATQFWADYPGLEVDEEVIYITMSYFNFASYAGAYDQRLWIVQKGVVGGLYGGGAATANAYDAYTAAGVGGFKSTTMPCQVFGAGGVGPGIGTYLLSYSGLTFGGAANPEALLVIRVDNPTGAPAFTSEFVTVGDIEDLGGVFGFPALPDAPQNGSVTPIEVNDRRALDAVWRNGFIYLTATIDPNASDAANQGTTTAHLFELDATAVTSSASASGLISLNRETNIGAEDVATGTYTFFPAVAVNSLGDIKVGFAGSASTIYGSAFVAEVDQTTFAPSATMTVRAGVDYYVRTFGGARNRWGDYSGISVDPADGVTFWVFNQWADTRGTVISGEDGRWATAWLSCVQQSTEDFGDAPPPYPTLLAANGARHTIVPGFFMGNFIDPEADGIPHPNALGDDLTLVPDDEDGVTWLTPLVPGQIAQVQVIAAAPGYVDIYVDVNINGSWLDPQDLVYSGPVAVGVNNLPALIPVGSTPGITYARVRYNAGLGPLPPTGPAQNGEVEDYEVRIDPADLDFGDAPDPTYSTLLASNGARHSINPNVFMGNVVDAEPDGQPDPLAKGDDINGLPDEDGLIGATILVIGQSAQFDVLCSVPGWIDIWIDLNINGTFADPGDLVYSGPVINGVNFLPFPIPFGSVSGPSFTRIRYNTVGPLNYNGPASDGEVEDYEVFLNPPLEDFGDAPDPSYPTLLASNGARHTIMPGIFMGSQIDSEFDGQPTGNADGDDLNNLADEDGVAFITTLVWNQNAQVDVTVSTGGWLDAWIDFDGNGIWDPSDQIYSGVVSGGLNSITFLVPATGFAGRTYARFRYNTAGLVLNPDGAAPDGEVEDYVVEIFEPEEDFGDAPDPTYPTLLVNNGARHLIQPGVFMGNRIDGEPDGQPSPLADGDDLANLPDEDGVLIAIPLQVGQNAQVDVFCSVTGWLDIWVDLNQNGSWFDPGELVYTGPANPGLNPIPFLVPGTASPGQTYMRVRYNLNGPLAPDGPAPDGEVEDYLVDVLDPEIDFGDAPTSYGTLLAGNGARHNIVVGIFMGNRIDGEPDGQPGPLADRDDNNNLPDEDGVTFVTGLTPGQNDQVDVNVTTAGWFDLWIDTNYDGVFGAGELVISAAVNPGLNSLGVTLPGLTVPGNTYARARYNTGGSLPPTGPATDGEVEDYLVTIEDPPLDFGDASDPTYPTLLASNGARHVINPGVFMGALIDAEANGQPAVNAEGDDVAGVDDEDGASFTSPMVVGGSGTLQVTVSQTGWVDVWVDFDRDGTWAAGEKVVSSAATAGVNNFSVTVPGGATAGMTFMRVRYNLGGTLSPTGLAGDGEVEDHRVTVQTTTGIPGHGEKVFHLGAAFPNPFGQATTIAFTIPEEQNVRVKVFTMTGRLAATLVDDRLPAGDHQVGWNGTDDHGRPMPAGVYFYRLEAGDRSQTKRLIFIR